MSSRRTIVFEGWKVVEVDGFRIAEECARCGACCRINVPGCEFYSEDSVKPRCLKEGGWKPVHCVHWPLHDSENVPEGCSVRWEKK